MKRHIATLVIFFILAASMPVFALTNEDERKYGKEIYLEIARSAPINNDPYISLYLNDIRGRLESKTTMPFPTVLTVIDSPTIDAFATIGGYVYIAAGLIANCDNEEEVAGVMAHEFAHIRKRHIAKRMEKQKYLNATVVATMLAAMLVGDSARGAVLATGMGAAHSMALRYSREDEEEADREGSILANDAGYGGLGIADFLKKLRSGGGDKLYPQYLLTHPYHESRIINLEKTWTRKPPSVDTSLFPYIIARAKVVQTYRSRGLADDIWVRRYGRDSTDPVAAYGAALYHSLRGNFAEAVRIARTIVSPYRNLLLGEIYVAASRFPEAAQTLDNVNERVGRYYLARAYEGMGRNDLAARTYRSLDAYAPVYPEIYYRLGMILGRTGDEAGGHAALGRYYMYKGNYMLARTNFEKAISRYGINSREGVELMRLIDNLEDKEKKK
ncbi:MAG: M48 family metalloprotease [Syntrophorhabdaceae bacterium]|nr:M48 family metalloprotease [Syntrophorhabdaceae bacterium]